MSDEWEDDANGWDDDDGDDWGEFEDNVDDDEAAAEEADAVWVQIDNLFYEADDNRRRRPERALEQFERCVELEKSTGTRISKRFKVNTAQILSSTCSCMCVCACTGIGTYRINSDLAWSF